MRRCAFEERIFTSISLRRWGWSIERDEEVPVGVAEAEVEGVLSADEVHREGRA